MAKASGPADRLQGSRDLQQRKLAFEIEVFELQLEYARAIGATDRIEELEETVRVARERLESDSAGSVKPEMGEGR